MIERPGYGLKRVFDLAIIIVASPFVVLVGAVISVILYAVPGGSVLYRQMRIGLGGEPFELLKFRTMNDNRDADGALLSDRERLTMIGRVLRKTSLDELPQLINVIRGEMSLVGPRPLYVRYGPFYTTREATRHRVRPGITGLAQVAGRNDSSWHDRLELDARYAERPTMLRDLRILIQTLLQTVRSEGVSVVAGDSGDPLDVERSYPNLENFRLRRMYKKDIENRVEWMNHPATRLHMTLPEGVTEESTLAWYEEAQKDEFRHEFVVEDSSGFVVAMTGLRAQEAGGPAEFYIFTSPHLHGGGIGTVATRLTLAHCRSCYAYSAVTLTVASGNLAAVRIYENLGFIVYDSGNNRQRMRLNMNRESLK